MVPRGGDVLDVPGLARTNADAAPGPADPGGSRSYDADPASFPASWLLSAPGDYQDFWGRIIISPQLAAWHDIYLVALTMLLVAAAVPGRPRKPLLVAGGLVAVGAVLMQLAVAP